MSFALKRGRVSRWMVGIWLLGLLTARPSAAEVVVIVNKGAPDSITREQVADIFMGKASALPGGLSAMPLDLPPSHPLRDEFYTKVIGKSAAQARSYWAKMSFTGKGTPPREAESSAEVKRAVAAKPGGIGYIEKSDVDSSVKVILTVN